MRNEQEAPRTPVNLRVGRIRAETPLTFSLAYLAKARDAWEALRNVGLNVVV